MIEDREIETTVAERRHHTTVLSVVNTLEWLLVAFILALVFRAFEMEAFRIPTGSMAETLRGAHYHHRCMRCGFTYDVGADSSYFPRARCASCGFEPPEGQVFPISNGDRIVVLKCIYQFFEPKRWDVVVFKNPLNPPDSFIKRLVGRPGETVEIIDGDIYINSEIARKPPKVQEELWMPVYDGDYPPAMVWLGHGAVPAGFEGGGGRWRKLLRNEQDSEWNLEAEGLSVLALDSDNEQIHIIYYEARGDAFRATYGYNDSRNYFRRPYCSDLMVCYWIHFERENSKTGAVVSKYGISYHGSVSSNGTMLITKQTEDGEVELAQSIIEPPVLGEAVKFQFANVDHQLILEFGQQKLKYDLGIKADDAGDRSKRFRPGVKIFGAGKLKLRHVGIFRDIHYLDDDNVRAGEGNPFKIGKDEFFVCGDNSPVSDDGRRWGMEGFGNNSKVYRSGIVPRDYLVGKAFFVYWSEAFRPLPTLLPVIPNIGRIGFIYGGSDDEL